MQSVDVAGEPKKEVPAAEVAPPAAEPAQQSFQTEGQIPTVEKGGATPATATASQLAFEKPQAAASTAAIEHGVHHPDDYKAQCDAAGQPEKWQERYRAGYTKADAWSGSPKAGMSFTLKKGHSASAAIAEWFKGPTIADFRTISVAEQLDELRDELGNPTFDRLFGSATGEEDKLIPGAQRLHISEAMYTTPFIDQMKAIAREADDKANRPEAQQPKTTAAPEEEKKPRPGKDAAAKHDTQADQDVDFNQRELGFGSEDLQRV